MRSFVRITDADLMFGDETRWEFRLWFQNKHIFVCFPPHWEYTRFVSMIEMQFCTEKKKKHNGRERFLEYGGRDKALVMLLCVRYMRANKVPGNKQKPAIWNRERGAVVIVGWRWNKKEKGWRGGGTEGTPRPASKWKSISQKNAH